MIRTSPPPYYVVPIIHNEMLKKYSKLEEVLSLPDRQIDDEAMTEMNYRIDVESNDVANVFKAFLEKMVWYNGQSLSRFCPNSGSPQLPLPRG